MNAHAVRPLEAHSHFVLVELKAPVSPRPELFRLGTTGALQRDERDLLSALCGTYGQAHAHVLRGNVIRVGRALQNDIVLADESVSASHATLHWDPDLALWVVDDLQSRNGTYLNGAPVKGPEPLPSGTHLLFGETWVLVHTEAVYRRTKELAQRHFHR